uniref:Uncharacterized protein n=1 Tax=Schistocephalus solidus TaxID=70667 RepID=A0A0X3P181_SCHSO
MLLHTLQSFYATSPLVISSQLHSKLKHGIWMERKKWGQPSPDRASRFLCSNPPARFKLARGCGYEEGWLGSSLVSLFGPCSKCPCIQIRDSVVARLRAHAAMLNLSRLLGRAHQ